MAKNKSTTHIDKLGAYDSFRAPWESEAGGDADVDKPTLKRLVYNLKKDLATARDSVDDVKADLADTETALEEAKTQAADGTGAEAQKTIDKLTTQLADAQAKVDKFEADKELADLRKEVLGDFEAKNPKAAKYVTGTTQEELEASLEEVKADWGIVDGDENEEDEDEDTDLDKASRISPRGTRLQNNLDPLAGKPGDAAVDFDKVADNILSGGRVFG